MKHSRSWFAEAHYPNLASFVFGMVFAENATMALAAMEKNLGETLPPGLIITAIVPGQIIVMKGDYYGSDT